MNGRGQSRIRVKKGGKRYLKAVAKAVMAWFKIRRELELDKLKKRSAIVEDLDNGIKLYVEIAKSWLVKAIKHPLISIVRDPDLNLNFITNGAIKVPPYELSSRLMKAKVRLKGILKGVLEQTTEENIPMPLVSFLASLIRPG